jgi:hypothetical protein
VIQVVSTGSGEVAVFAIGQEARGFIAIGQVATGVIAVGQLARGVIAVGQLALGVFAVGMVGGGVLWCTAFVGIGGTSGPGLVYGLLGRARVGQWPRRLLALARREPWDTAPRWPTWRRADGLILLSGLAALWWFLAGQSTLAALS